jgi:predicted porin
MNTLGKSKSIVVLSLLLSGITMAGPACAQSSVTIWGILDTNIEHLTNVPDSAGKPSSLTQLNGGSYQSRIGFSGSEDLGGGNSTFFHLETGFGLNNGETTPGVLFARSAYLGIKTADFGSISLGRQLSLSNDDYYFDPFVQESYGSASLVKGRNWTFTNNAVTYDSPTFGGFSFSAQLGSSTDELNSTEGRITALKAVYSGTTFNVRAIYDEIRDPNGRLSDLYAASREFMLGGAVTLDKVKLSAAYTRLQAPDATTGPTSANYWWGGADYHVTVPIDLIGAVYRITTNDSDRATLGVVGANYAFSKRTTLYARIAYAANGANSGLGVNPFDLPVTGKSQVGTMIGLRHFF